ncbi:MAG: YqhA family protein [Planctomycetota bacterium]
MLKRIESLTEWSVFASRWLLAPLYVGLIIGQICYSVSFFHELWHLGNIAIFGTEAIVDGVKTHVFSERTVVAVLLGLVDMIMVANLVIMVLIGGYATFVSKLDLDDQVDRPAWLDHIDPGTLKTKLAGALVSISGIHLLQSFNSIGTLPLDAPVNHGVIAWQVGIHVAFIVTTLMLAWSDLVFERKLKLAHDTECEREAAKEHKHA